MMHGIVDMQAADYAGIADLTAFDPRQMDAERADRHFAVLDAEQKLRARCSVWWRDTARVDGQATGAIGHYAATDGANGAAVISRALHELKNRGARVAVGPLDGNTWRRYRFVTGRGTAKPFFLEPDNPAAWPAHFTEQGFRPLAHYVSELNPDIANRQPELGSLREKFAAQGVRVEPLNADDPADDMAGIYRVVCASFRDAFMYSPLDMASYRQLYAPLVGQVDPRLVLVARHHDEVVGFILAPPDFLQRHYRQAMDAIVIKTVAVLPRPEYRGLGRVLIVDALRNALDMGFTAAISALMHTGNRSQEISRDCAGPMRNYTLYARALGP